MDCEKYGNEYKPELNPILKGNDRIAYRDPACYFWNDIYYLFYTKSYKEDGYLYNHIALSESKDLITWTEAKLLTPKDKNLNFSSPGNIIKYRDEFVICFTSYPMKKKYSEVFIADESARLYTMRTKDFKNFTDPELIEVKGDISVESMGRMIDPFIFEDKFEKGKYWIFYKQNGVSMSYSYDLKKWSYFGNVSGGENACIILKEDKYLLVHSPENGIGIKESADLREWKDKGLFFLNQENWAWAKGRITAGFLMESNTSSYKYILFFHGSTEDSFPETHGNASIGIAFSNDLKEFYYQI